MTDTRQVLEEAFKEVHCRNDPDTYRVLWLRFRRFLDAEAWTDAALCLVPEGWLWRIIPSDAQGHWLSEVWTDDTGDCEFAVRDETPAVALVQACRKARENADG